MKKGIKKQMCENMEQSWATNTEVQQEWSREEEWADPEKEKKGEKGWVWRWQKGSAEAACYRWDSPNSSAIFKS